jgi:hypothetical protein
MVIPFWLSNIEKEQAQTLVNIGFQLSQDMSEENLFDDQTHVGSWKICKSNFRNISAFDDYPMAINETVQAYCNGVIYEVYVDGEADEFYDATEIIDELSIAYSQAIACIKTNMSKQSENQLILLEI